MKHGRLRVTLMFQICSLEDDGEDFNEDCRPCHMALCDTVLVSDLATGREIRLWDLGNIYPMGTLRIPQEPGAAMDQNCNRVPYSLRLIYDLSANDQAVACLCRCHLYVWHLKSGKSSFENAIPIVINDLPSFAKDISCIRHHDKHRMQVSQHLL